MTTLRVFGTAMLLVLLAAPAGAAPIVRSGAALEQLLIQGITLAMSPRQAFETLKAAGFQAGDLQTFEDWQSDGVEFVRGVYGSPSGHSSVVFSRRGERIVSIAETFNSPGNPIDAVAAIEAVRGQLGIAPDDPKCRVVGAHSGFCEVQDAADGSAANILFKLQILTVMRLVSVSRSQELAL